jgi:hypothetical protein
MTPDRDGARYRVHFDELAFAEDLRHASPAGRDVARAARTRLERDGAGLGELGAATPSTEKAPGCPTASRPTSPAPAGAGG